MIGSGGGVGQAGAGRGSRGARGPEAGRPVLQSIREQGKHEGWGRVTSPPEYTLRAPTD